MQTEHKPAIRRGIYLLPNLFTTAALFAAFYSIVAAMKGDFNIAAIAIVIAGVADALDGRIARLTNTQSAFGAQYDSLSDMVAFGVAPALLIYSWSLSHLGKLGWLIAFFYAAATALRLARFNTQIHPDADKRYFQGLPCPVAAGAIVTLVWWASNYEVEGTYLVLPVALLTLFVGMLMVSTIRYYSFKQVDIAAKMPFVSAVLLVLLIAAISVDPAPILFGITFCFICFGPIATLWQKRKMRRERKLNHR